MGGTSIEWCDMVLNCVTGCTKVSEGCRFCYAERVFPRAYGKAEIEESVVVDGITANKVRRREFTDVLMHPDRLELPLHWRKPRRIFVNSMSDLFHEDVPFEFIDKVFAMMALCPQHCFQVLTKRPERMLEFCSSNETRDRLVNETIRLTEGISGTSLTISETGDGLNGVRLENVQLGISCEDQKTADERTAYLRATPAAVRFISYEPALQSVNFNLQGIHWLICGGESGPGARPMHPGWARSVRDQCQAAGVPFFFKQWGEYLHRDAMTDQQFALIDATETLANTTEQYFRVGKKFAGALLDGREWREFP